MSQPPLLLGQALLGVGLHYEMRRPLYSRAATEEASPPNFASRARQERCVIVVLRSLSVRLPSYRRSASPALGAQSCKHNRSNHVLDDKVPRECGDGDEGYLAKDCGIHRGERDIHERQDPTELSIDQSRVENRGSQEERSLFKRVQPSAVQVCKVLLAHRIVRVDQFRIQNVPAEALPEAEHVQHVDVHRQANNKQLEICCVRVLQPARVGEECRHAHDAIIDCCEAKARQQRRLRRHGIVVGHTCQSGVGPDLSSSTETA
mmetsp:Transcript_66972/g.216431  ORF Transcript_66972/g.216431 Transcript_66972/m.216431 type:complete len:262 (-) Transcript_66972:12-797(-)